MPLLLSLAKHPSVATVSSLVRLHRSLLVPAADRSDQSCWTIDRLARQFSVSPPLSPVGGGHGSDQCGHIKLAHPRFEMGMILCYQRNFFLRNIAGT